MLATLRASRDGSSSTRPSQLWLECLSGTSREHACARKQSARHRRASTPSTLTRGAGRQPRAVCARSRHEEGIHGRLRTIVARRARSPGGQHEFFLISFHRGSTLSLSAERPLFRFGQHVRTWGLTYVALDVYFRRLSESLFIDCVRASPGPSGASAQRAVPLYYPVLSCIEF